MVDISQDVRWPFPGDVVTLQAASVAGDRVRYKLTAKPDASALELWSTAGANWLVPAGDTRAVITPDVDGCYTVHGVDEDVTVNAMHYSNDGGTGLSKGTATSTAVASATHVINVGVDVRRPVGFQPNAIELRIKAHSSGSTHGALTWHAGVSYAPILTGASTDRARTAMAATAVGSAMAAMGGTGYAGTAALVAWSSVVASSEIRQVCWTLCKVNTHAVASTITVHHATEIGQTVTAADAAAKTGLVAVLNDVLAKYETHRKSSGGSLHAHYLGDTSNVASGLSPLSTTVSTAACVERLVVLRGHFEAHAVLVFNDVSQYDPMNEAGGSLGVHNAPGDWTTRCTVRTSASTATLASACAGGNDLKAKYNTHRTYADGGTVIESGYQTPTGALSSYMLQAGFPVDWAGCVETINKQLDVWQAHVKNTRHTTGSAATIHGAAEWTSRTDTIPRVAQDDVAGAVQAREYLDHMIDRHVRVKMAGATEIHGTSCTGGLWTHAPAGAARVHLAYQDSIQQASAAAPPNENQAAAYLIQRAGWEKVT